MSACNDELKSRMEHQTYESVERPKDKKVISTKWVFAIKVQPNGLVARGFKQKKGIDYDETFSPVVSFAAIRLLLAMAASQKMLVHQMDIKTAFLNGEIDKEIHVEPAPGYVDHGKVWKLFESLYGLKQAPKCWFEKLANYKGARAGFRYLNSGIIDSRMFEILLLSISVLFMKIFKKNIMGEDYIG